MKYLLLKLLALTRSTVCFSIIIIIIILWTIVEAVDESMTVPPYKSSIQGLIPLFLWFVLFFLTSVWQKVSVLLHDTM